MAETLTVLGRQVKAGREPHKSSGSEMSGEGEGPFADVKGCKGSAATKVILPNPEKFDGDLTTLVPAHDPDTEAYLQHLP